MGDIHSRPSGVHGHTPKALTRDAWPKRSIVSIREELILKVLARESTVVELAEEYDVSRKTIYKWLERYEKRGLAGLVDGSNGRSTPR
jgi:transposase